MIKLILFTFAVRQLERVYGLKYLCGLLAPEAKCTLIHHFDASQCVTICVFVCMSHLSLPPPPPPLCVFVGVVSSPPLYPYVCVRVSSLFPSLCASVCVFSVSGCFSACFCLRVFSVSRSVSSHSSPLSVSLCECVCIHITILCMSFLALFFSFLSLLPSSCTEFLFVHVESFCC